MFLRIAGAGGAGPGGGGVVRSRRQVWTVNAPGMAGEIDVVLGVNGFVWICKHGSIGGQGEEAGEGPRAGSGSAAWKTIGITRLEDGVSEKVYSPRNDSVAPEMRREIARLAECVKALVENGVKIDEEMVMRAYEASLEQTERMEIDGEVSNEGLEYLSGEKSRRVVAEALAKSSAMTEESL